MQPLKPSRGTQLDKTHPLARSLALYWLFNEGAGATVSDSSENGRTGTLQGAPSWVAGKFGSTLEYDGADDRVDSSSPVISSVPVSASLWFRVDELPSARAEDGTLLIQRTVGIPYQSFRALIEDAGDKLHLLIYNSSGINTATTVSDQAVQAGVWYHVVFILDSNCDTRMYLNGIRQNDTDNSGSFYNANDVLRLGSRTGTTDDFKGKIDHVMVFNRVLSDSEVSLLYREPFCMFSTQIRPELLCVFPTMLPLAGAISSHSTVSATLRSIQGSSGTQMTWLRDALFNGMTSVAFKLGTTLGLGWFWFRVTGCSVLYRGPNLEQVDFDDLLAVVERYARQVSPPGYTPHNSGSAYTYVVRRFNEYGYQEETLAASAKISLDSDGKLEEPKPNKIFILKAEQVEGGRVRLVWFYCPLDQESKPVHFKVYYDGGAGRIDLDDELATIPYEGLKFYHYKSAPLESARYAFTVRAEDANSTKDGSSARLNIELNAAKPNSIDILSTARL